VRERAAPAIERLQREADAPAAIAQLACEEPAHRHAAGAYEFHEPGCRGRLARSGPARDQQPERCGHAQRSALLESAKSPTSRA
jgi:hypothetical protein